MLKQYRCPQCGVMSAHDVQSDEDLYCNCDTGLIEYKTDLFPTNLEIIQTIANLTHQLAMAKIDLLNSESQKNAISGSLKMTSKALMDAKEELMMVQKELDALNALVEDDKNKT